MSKPRLYAEAHILQTVPSSCINRDDTGTPKSCIYGGVERSRISSQAWKRAVRQEFAQLLPSEELGVRTKKIVELVQKEILRLDPEISSEKAEKGAIFALEKAGLKIKNAAKGIDALFFMSQKQATALAQLYIAGEKETDKYKLALKEHPSIDIALFGRMVASKDRSLNLNYDACCQVAHAISTHAVETEYDYFTAVDDLASEDQAGAAHLGVTEYSSATLYRYANINCLELFKVLGQQTPKIVRTFMEAFVLSMPTGKINSFANQTLPCSVYFTLRIDRPVSLVPAFEKSIKSSSQGYEKESQKALVDYEKKTLNFVKAPLLEVVVGEGLDELSHPISLMEALDLLEKEVAAFLPGGEI